MYQKQKLWCSVKRVYYPGIYFFFYYDRIPVKIVKQFKYLGLVFTVSGSFAVAQNTLSGQAQKAIFKLNKYLYKFTFISPKHSYIC